jgi:nucleotide-binding universal stress UspA family protein
MFTHLLVPTDGSALSRRAVAQAVAFASQAGARITFFIAVESLPKVYADPSAVFGALALSQYAEGAHGVAAAMLEEAAAMARDAGVPYRTEQAVCDAPYAGIIDAAKRHECDLIFMASHGRRGVNALLLGSETHKVLTHSPVPVLVCR